MRPRERGLSKVGKTRKTYGVSWTQVAHLGLPLDIYLEYIYRFFQL